MTEDDSVDIENENGNRFEEYEWCGQKRIRATTLLEGGFRGATGFWGHLSIILLWKFIITYLKGRDMGISLPQKAESSAFARM